jgi:hypothetical protein
MCSWACSGTGSIIRYRRPQPACHCDGSNGIGGEQTSYCRDFESGVIYLIWTVRAAERHKQFALRHFEMSKQPDFRLIHNTCQYDGGDKDSCDERGCEWRHQDSSKRQRINYQKVQTAR